MTAWLGQYCLNVADLERSVAWYCALGLECTSRTEIPEAFEAIVENPAGGGKLQLAQQKSQAGAVALGNAFWKLYVNTADVEATFIAAVSSGAEVIAGPLRQERWPVSIAFVKDPDDYLVEFVERHPWPSDELTSRPWLGQYCLNVSDLEATVSFYESLGLTCTSRTEIGHAHEAILEAPGKGAKMQLAQQKSAEPLDPGQALWKLYVNVEDCEATYRTALAQGAKTFIEPTTLERWPVMIAFVTDRDGYLIELVQRLR